MIENSIKIVIISVPWNLNELYLLSKSAIDLNYQLYVIDNKKNIEKITKNIICKKVSVEKMTVRLICEKLIKLNPNFIISITELNMKLAANVRKKLNNYVGNSPCIENTISNKYLTRIILNRNKISDIKFNLVTGKNIKEIAVQLGFPCIVKPLSLTGSAGIRLLKNINDINKFKNLYEKKSLFYSSKKNFIVEEYIDGKEISVDGIVIGGKFFLFSISDKFNTGVPFFKDIGTITPSKYYFSHKSRIKLYMQKIVDALKIKISPLRAELKLLKNNCIEFIELHSHFGGGNIVGLLKNSFNYDVNKIFLSALNNKNIFFDHKHLMTSGVRYLTKYQNKINSICLKYPNIIDKIEINNNTPYFSNYKGIKILFTRIGFVLFSSKNNKKVIDFAQNIDL